jgi:hypothetical protein
VSTAARPAPPAPNITARRVVSVMVRPPRFSIHFRYVPRPV